MRSTASGDTAFRRWDDVEPCQGGNRQRPGAYVDFDLFTDWVFAEYPSFLEMLAGDRMESFHAGHSGGIHDNLMMHLAGALYYYGVIEQAVSMKRSDAVIGSWYAPGYRFIETHETNAATGRGGICSAAPRGSSSGIPPAARRRTTKT